EDDIPVQSNVSSTISTNSNQGIPNQPIIQTPMSQMPVSNPVDPKLAEKRKKLQQDPDDSMMDNMEKGVTWGINKLKSVLKTDKKK
ncbi:cell wall protein, partial [Bacillus cereus]